jgi:hypothetical protein
MRPMTTTSVDPDEVRRRARERQERQTAALDAILDARYAAIAALEADEKAMKVGEEAGLTAEQLEKDGVPSLPVAEKPARRQRAPRGSAGAGAPRGRRPRAPADAQPVAPAHLGNGPVPAHVGAQHGE